MKHNAGFISNIQLIFFLLVKPAPDINPLTSRI